MSRKPQIHEEKAKVVPGAHLMDFGGLLSLGDGVIYIPTVPRGHPGTINKPFPFKYSECDIPVKSYHFGLLVGACASMCMRKIVASHPVRR